MPKNSSYGFWPVLNERTRCQIYNSNKQQHNKLDKNKAKQWKKTEY